MATKSKFSVTNDAITFSRNRAASRRYPSFGRANRNLLTGRRSTKACCVPNLAKTTSASLERSVGSTQFALILAKVILIAEALHAGKRSAGATMFAAVMFKSGLFAIILICFNFVEDVLVGLFHGKTLAVSFPELAGGGLEGQLLVGLMIFVVLIPFFAFTELRRAIGEDEFHDLVFRQKTH